MFCLRWGTLYIKASLPRTEVSSRYRNGKPLIMPRIVEHLELTIGRKRFVSRNFSVEMEGNSGRSSYYTERHLNIGFSRLLCETYRCWSYLAERSIRWRFLGSRYDLYLVSLYFLESFPASFVHNCTFVRCIRI